MSDVTKILAVSPKLLDEICNSLNNINGWGSIEIFIQNYKVTQVIEKNIKKPSISILAENEVLIQE
jgi:hypothetical protein